MNSLWVAWHVIKRTVGSPKTSLIMIVMPAALVGLVMLLLNQSGDDKPGVAVYHEESLLAAALIAEIENKNAVTLSRMESEAAVREAVRNREVSVGILMPNDIDSRLLGKDGDVTAELIMLSQGAISVQLQMQLEDGIARISKFLHDLDNLPLNEASREEILSAWLDARQENRVTADIADAPPSGTTSYRLMMGLFVLFMMALMNSSVVILVEDRNNGVLARTSAAPIRPQEISIGYFLGSFAAGTLQVAIVTGFLFGVMGFGAGLSWWSSFLILETFLLAALGLSTAITGTVKDGKKTSVLNGLVIAPTCMLGGCFWPVEVMPDWMQTASWFVPQTWVLDALLRTANGEALNQMMLNLGILVLFGIVMLGFGSALLRPYRR